MCTQLDRQRRYKIEATHQLKEKKTHTHAPQVQREPQADAESIFESETEKSSLKCQNEYYRSLQMHKRRQQEPRQLYPAGTRASVRLTAIVILIQRLHDLSEVVLGGLIDLAGRA